MSGNSNIAWTNKTWNPVRGCARVSEGCRKCYAEVMTARHSYPGGWGEGLAQWVTRPDGKREARWTGLMQPVPEALDAPRRWRSPARVFVNSMSDLFHEGIPEDFITDVWRTMADCQQHVFQILTKRPQRMRDRLLQRLSIGTFIAKPLPNVWLGVSAEDQATFDERVPLLLQTPAAVRFVSLEPLLGHIDLIGKDAQGSALHAHEGRPPLDWGIVGGESGSEPRAMDMEAARYIVRQFRDAGVPLFVKQDNGPRPGLQGRFTTDEWALKEYPALERVSAR